MMTYIVHKNKKENKHCAAVNFLLAGVFVLLSVYGETYRFLTVLIAVLFGFLAIQILFAALGEDKLLVLTEDTMEICLGLGRQSLKLPWKELSNCKLYKRKNYMEVKIYYKDKKSKNKCKKLLLGDKFSLSDFMVKYMAEEVEEVYAMIDNAWKVYGNGEEQNCVTIHRSYKKQKLRIVQCAVVVILVMLFMWKEQGDLLWMKLMELLIIALFVGTGISSAKELSKNPDYIHLNSEGMKIDFGEKRESFFRWSEISEIVLTGPKNKRMEGIRFCYDQDRWQRIDLSWTTEKREDAAETIQQFWEKYR